MSRPKRVSKGPLVGKTYDRMVEMMSLLTESQRADVRIEYSAFLCAAATTMAVSRGIDPTAENCSRIMRLMADKVIPEIETAVDALEFE
jgi:hypothetical protein